MGVGGNSTDESGNTCLIEHEVNSTESATHAVMEAVAAVSNTELKEMPPLYDTVETEALDRLVTSRINSASRTNVLVQFTYCGTHVTVNGKTIEIHLSKE